MTGEQLHRVAGTLLGAAVGDALGAGYESCQRPPPDPHMIGGGPFGFAPGEWTDDTQMSVCVAEVAARGHLDPSVVGDRFLDWFRAGPNDVGNQTRWVLERARTGDGCAPLAAAYFRANPHNAAGNGSLMRTAPVALAHLGDPATMAASAREISELTHADPQAAEACILWCAAIERAVLEGSLEGAAGGLALLGTRAPGRWSRVLREAETRPPGTFQGNGYVVRALQAAHAAVHQTPVPTDQPCLHLQDALRAAVAIGDDADTVAAIAGALLGARWGVSAVPFAWRRVLHGWPGYRSGDLVRLAVLTAQGGMADPSTGWPAQASLLPYYRQHYSLSGALVALPDDEGVVIGDVAALPEALREVDVVISLCRIGIHDIPKTTEHHQLWLIDSDEEHANPNLDFVLRDTAEGIATCRDQGKRVFVHCVHAQARTPAVAAAYLAGRLSISGHEAAARVSRLLPGIVHRPSFVRSLDRLWPTQR